MADDWSAVDEIGRDPAAGPRPGAKLRRGPQAPKPAAPPSHRGALIALAVAVLLVVAVGGWFAFSLFQPLKGDGRGQVEVRVPTGATVGEIADVLEQRGVISSSFFFSLRARLDGKNGELKSGRYTLPRDISHSAALEALIKGPPPPKLVKFTIREGRSIHETAERLRDESLRGDYVAATRSSRRLDPRAYGARRGTRNLEGFLFPATYDLKPDAPVSALVDAQLAAFKQNFATLDLRQARRRKLSPYEVLIVASLVEREAELDRERPLIAAVIYNRLREGIPLGIDATTRYEKNDFENPLSDADFAKDTPYNTRKRKGLPPTPIGNPGLASMRAAAKPARSNVLYFVVKPNSRGEHAFSSSYDQFLRDAERYSTARAQRGNRAP